MDTVIAKSKATDSLAENMGHLESLLAKFDDSKYTEDGLTIVKGIRLTLKSVERYAMFNPSYFDTTSRKILLGLDTSSLKKEDKKEIDDILDDKISHSFNKNKVLPVFERIFGTKNDRAEKSVENDIIPSDQREAVNQTLDEKEEHVNEVALDTSKSAKRSGSPLEGKRKKNDNNIEK